MVVCLRRPEEVVGSLGADIKCGSEPPDVGPRMQTGNAFLTTSAPSLAPSLSALEFCELF